jgi:hypothetical protein
MIASCVSRLREFASCRTFLYRLRRQEQSWKAQSARLNGCALTVRVLACDAPPVPDRWGIVIRSAEPSAGRLRQLTTEGKTRAAVAGHLWPARAEVPRAGRPPLIACGTRPGRIPLSAERAAAGVPAPLLRPTAADRRRVVRLRRPRRSCDVITVATAARHARPGSHPHVIHDPEHAPTLADGGPQSSDCLLLPSQSTSDDVSAGDTGSGQIGPPYKSSRRGVHGGK